MKITDVTFALHRKGDHEVTFEVSDASLAEGGYNYYGFLSAEGGWIIQRQNVAETEYRYCAGGTAYSDAWTIHTSLSYGLFSQLT